MGCLLVVALESGRLVVASAVLLVWAAVQAICVGLLHVERVAPGHLVVLLLKGLQVLCISKRKVVLQR